MTAVSDLNEPGWYELAARLLGVAQQPAATRVLVVDDHQLFAEMLTIALEARGRFDVVGHARDGREAIELAAWLRPDVVVMDVQMPVLGGIDATPRVLAAAPGTRVVVVSAADSRDTRARAREAGAVEFLGKETPADELVRALERAVCQVVPLRPRRPPSESADHLTLS